MEDIFRQKQELLVDDLRGHEKIAERLRKGKGMDDQVAKSLLAAVAKMEQRVSLLS